MFVNEYEHTIDAKGRMAVPAKFRAQIDRGAVISKGMGTCLSVYPRERWDEKSAELAAGKASELNMVWDKYALMQQIGALASPAAR